MNIFEQATRQGLRFASPKGQLTTEDLWQLPLTGKSANLDDIARQLHRQLKETEGEISFVKPASETTTARRALDLSFAVVTRIIEVKVTERDEAKAAADKAATKQKLLEVLDRKQNAELESKSPEELRSMIASL